MNAVISKCLRDLLPEVDEHLATLAVTGLVVDSRQVRPGDLFLAFPGETQDGRDHIPHAISAGAALIIAEAGVGPVAGAVPVVEVKGLRARVSAIAGRFFDEPSRELRVIGVTGTNGKTSCTQLLGQALRLAGQSCGVIGTLGASLDGSVGGGSLTTPDPVALQAQLSAWRDREVANVAMEVSSHGLVQGRVNGVDFHGAVFTNLSRDHLDYHGDMVSYGRAKKLLFERPGLAFAVLNEDDPFAAELARDLRERRLLRVVTFGTSAHADVHAVAVEYTASGMQFELSVDGERTAMSSQLLGPFNLSNLLAVIAVLRELGLDLATIAALVPRLKPIAGRMERVPVDSEIDVVVDYAHTPDALAQALRALRGHCHGRLWCVFGCGGDRDQGKRPLMGRVAETEADVVVLTSDNPRGEAPDQILAQIAAGMSRNAVTLADRAAAIDYAVAEAQPGDVILLAGKGHEAYQLIDGQRRPFSDSAAARAALLARKQRGASA
ncbi:MAG: UDP-N-acetylmuramoyl-L-alanyl-D-glutamate--2,6-diaminopimelate ligase [Spongiibacteraceae bacterium]|jgi:UDP-N-acetylmuramoyl-L-alanyl-D-glutamate--2,6-diaminopimelate ligase|nr:UDP-N-acetylmuramoyl-L-alanyl-D-glutamate--2,6-diaminopimelate ligase [Spongiibacteraceae bacterium]